MAGSRRGRDLRLQPGRIEAPLDAASTAETRVDCGLTANAPSCLGCWGTAHCRAGVARTTASGGQCACRKRAERQEVFHERWLLRMPRLPGPGRDANWRGAHRSAAAFIRLVPALRSSTHESNAALHKQGLAGPGSGGHLRLPEIDSAASQGKRHPVGEQVSGFFHRSARSGPNKLRGGRSRSQSASYPGFLSTDEARTLLSSYRVRGAWVGGAGVSPAVLLRDGQAKIASGTLAPPNPALRSKVWGHRSTFSNCRKKCRLRCILPNRGRTRTKDDEVRYGVSKSCASEDVGRKMRLQWNPRESNQTCKPIGQPDVPARIRVPIGEDRGDGKCGNRVAGREAPDASQVAPVAFLEPGLRELPVRGNRSGAEAAIDVFHHCGKNLGVKDGLARKQYRMLRVRVL